MVVIELGSGECRKVYDITYDNTGHPHFLIYKNNEWHRVSAKHFQPID